MIVDKIVGANEDIISYNLYLYCSNNLISYDDISGCWKIPKWLKKVAKVVAVVAVTVVVPAAVIAASQTVATLAAITGIKPVALGSIDKAVTTVAQAATVRLGVINAVNGANKVGEIITGTNVIHDVAIEGNEDLYDALDTCLAI